MKKNIPDSDVLAPAIHTLIDLKDIVGAGVPTWSGLLFLMMFTRPGVTQQELADWAGLSKFKVSRVVRAYEERGMVIPTRNGRDKQLRLSKEAQALGRTLVQRNRALLLKVAVALR